MNRPIIAFLYPTPQQLADQKEADGVTPIHKLNGGMGATICHGCRTIITTGHTDDIWCAACKLNKFVVDPDTISEIDYALDEYFAEHRSRQLQQDEPFVWRTHKGSEYYLADMATSHLFYSLRMIFNHSVPPVFRVVGVGEEMKRYGDVPAWNEDYRRQAITELAAELETRDDLDTPLRRQFDDIKANARVIVALGL